MYGNDSMAEEMLVLLRDRPPTDIEVEEELYCMVRAVRDLGTIPAPSRRRVWAVHLGAIPAARHRAGAAEPRAATLSPKLIRRIARLVVLLVLHRRRYIRAAARSGVADDATDGAQPRAPASRSEPRCAAAVGAGRGGIEARGAARADGDGWHDVLAAAERHQQRLQLLVDVSQAGMRRDTAEIAPHRRHAPRCPAHRVIARRAACPRRRSRRAQW